MTRKIDSRKIQRIRRNMKVSRVLPLPHILRKQNAQHAPEENETYICARACVRLHVYMSIICLEEYVYYMSIICLEECVKVFRLSCFCTSSKREPHREPHNYI